MKKPLLCFLFLAFLFSVAKAQSFQWVTSDTLPSSNFIVRCDSGNIYVAGGRFISKYNASGALTWQQQIFGGGVSGIASDTSENLFVCGVFGSSFTAGNYYFTAPGGYGSTFLLKYDRNGIIQWAERTYNNADANADGMTIDKQGNPIIIGRFLDSLQINNFVLDAPLTNQVFLVKFSSNGICQWAKHLISDSFGGGGYGPKIESDKLGNSFIAGYFYDQLKFDTFQLSAHGGQFEDVFLAKIDSSGNFQWVKTLGGASTRISFRAEWMWIVQEIVI